jgi:hypothetical protein
MYDPEFSYKSSVLQLHLTGWVILKKNYNSTDVITELFKKSCGAGAVVQTPLKLNKNRWRCISCNITDRKISDAFEILIFS